MVFSSRRMPERSQFSGFLWGLHQDSQRAGHTAEKDDHVSVIEQTFTEESGAGRSFLMYV